MCSHIFMELDYSWRRAKAAEAMIFSQTFSLMPWMYSISVWDSHMSKIYFILTFGVPKK